jgi:hypothetical protein
MKREEMFFFNIFNKCVSLSIFSKWNENPQKPPKGKQHWKNERRRTTQENFFFRNSFFIVYLSRTCKNIRIFSWSQSSSYASRTRQFKHKEFLLWFWFVESTKKMKLLKSVLWWYTRMGWRWRIRRRICIMTS